MRLWMVGLLGWGCVADPDVPLNARIMDAALADAGDLDARIADARMPDAMRDAAPMPDALPDVVAMPDAVVVVDAAPDAVADAGPDALIDGGPVCVPERCNGEDDDCDGRVDEQLNLRGFCEAGVGECVRPGMKVCGPDDSVVCNAEAGPAGVELCDTLDNDCDGEIDENAAPEDLEDDIDNDCDGVIDEVTCLDELAATPRCEAGVGACLREGANICRGRPPEVLFCTAQPGNRAVELCNDDIDNDCDGRVDEAPNLAPCMQAIGVCQVAVDALCQADGSWGCPPEDPNLPVPPECEPVPIGDHLVLGEGAVDQLWVFEPTPEDDAAAILWRTGATVRIRRISVQGVPLGDAPVQAALMTQSIVRDGPHFAAFERTPEGFRWVRFDRNGAVLQRAAVLAGADFRAAEVFSVDLERIDGGFLIAFAVWHPERLGLHTARLGVDGAVLAENDIGGVAAYPNLVQGPEGVIVLTTTVNGRPWNAAQLGGGLPRTGQYGRLDEMARVMGRPGPRGIIDSLRAVPTPHGLLYLTSHPTELCLTLGANRSCGTVDALPSDAAAQGDSVLLIRSGITAQNTRGFTIQPVNSALTPLDMQRWVVANGGDGAFYPQLVRLADNMLIVWTSGNIIYAQLGLAEVDTGIVRCLENARLVAPLGQCQAEPVCVDLQGCQPNGPVCGCDGETYADGCIALQQGRSVWQAGACDFQRWPCPAGSFFDLNGEDLCKPCAAIKPVCGWEPRQNIEQGRAYPDLCALLEARPDVRLQDWTQGECAIVEAGGCREELCDAACPICAIDQQCYSSVDYLGERTCF
ncbi:MAG: hypothetical protein ACI9U2_004804 [Bradymonadia bacterium]|jgi:hypothetical protein